MSALVASRPRLLQITSIAVRGHVNIQPYSSDARGGDERKILPNDRGVKPFSEIPGPPSLPFFGNVLQYALGIYKLEKPYETYGSFFKKYGPLVKEHLFYKYVLVHVFNPKDLKEIYLNERPDFPIRSSHNAIKKYREAKKELYGHIGVAPSNGNEWNDYRTLLGKFSGKYMQYAKREAFEIIADDLMEFVKSNIDFHGEMNLFPALYYYTLECMGTILLGIRMGCFKDNKTVDVTRFIEAVHDTHYSIHVTELKPYILAMKEYKTLENAQDYIADFVLKHMSIIKRELELASIPNLDPFNETKRDKDLVIEDESNIIRTSMSLIYDKLKGGMKEDMILPMAADFFQGGIHSTAHTLAFALYHLARNEDKQEKLRSRMMDPIDRYINLVIDESLRLNPPAIGTGRVLNKDLVLSGYHVPKGTRVILHHEIASKNEENFPDPLKFRPERMANLNEDQKYSFKPFIEGSVRTCLGSKIAKEELRVALKKILSNFKISYHRENVGVVNKLLNEPDRPIRIKFEAISNNVPSSTTKSEQQA